MVPLFPTMVTEDGLCSNPRPISIQKLVPNQSSAQHHFKHLPVAQLQSVAQRAAADHQLEQTTLSLLQALDLQRGGEPTHGHTSDTDLDKAHSDSEISTVSYKRNNETSDSMQHIQTATTLLSEQATQTAASCRGPSVGQLPSLHLLRTLQARLMASLQQVSDLRAEGPWQSRVLDQPDWDRKLARMEEFHAKITREMYILTRQVDLIMDSVCSIPLSRVTSSMKGDVIRKLVRAHRSALRVTQAFVQNYWDGSLDGRQAGRFLQLLAVCRNLADVCLHLDIRGADISDLPERLASLVRQHVTTAGDVGSLIREMALGRFGPAAERRRGLSRQPARPGSTGSHPRVTHRQHHKVKSTIERLRASRTGEKLSVRSAPASRRVTGPSRATRPGSAPHTSPKVRLRTGGTALLPPLPEERDSFSSDEGDHRHRPDSWAGRRDRLDHPGRPKRQHGPATVVWSERDQPDHPGRPDRRHGPAAAAAGAWSERDHPGRPDRQHGPAAAGVWSERDRPEHSDALAATVELAVRRALAGSAAEPTQVDRPAGPGRRHDGGGGQLNSRGGQLSSRGGQLNSGGGLTDDRERQLNSRGGQPNSGGGLTDDRVASTDGVGGQPDSCGAPTRRRADLPDSGGPLSNRRGSLDSREGPLDGTAQPASREGARDSVGRGQEIGIGRRESDTHTTTQGGRRVGRRAPDSRTRRQLRHVLTRLDEMQHERDVIRRRWTPLIEARKRRSDEEDVYLGLELDDFGPVADSAPVGQLAGGSRLLSGTADPPQPVPPHTTGPLLPPHTDAATSTSTLAAPPPAGPQRSAPEPGAGLQRSVKDVFAAEALDPQLRSTLAAQLRGFLGNSEDHTINSLPEETVHQLVDEFISEAGVDIFLHQLFDQEFELR